MTEHVEPPAAEFMTPEEFAAATRLTIWTVRRLLRRRKIPGVKFGRKWHIPRAAANPENIAGLQHAAERA